MKSKGFTLAEIMVVIVIFGIIAAVAITRLQDSAGNFTADAAAEQLVQELREARTEALSRNARVDFSVAGTNLYALRELNTSNNSVRVIRDNVTMGYRDAKVTLTFNNLSTYGASNTTGIIFNRLGGVANVAGGTPSITVSSLSQTVTVTIQPTTGYIR